MKRGSKRVARDEEERRCARVRTTDADDDVTAAAAAAAASKAAAHSREEDDDSGSSNDNDDWEDASADEPLVDTLDDSEAEDDEVDDNDDGDGGDADDDDDEYAAFRREAAAATTMEQGMHTVTMDSSAVAAAAAAAGNDDSDLVVWRRDRQQGGGGGNAEDDGGNGGGDVELQYSNKAYDAFFQLRTEYPCLSFDVICDNEGSDRTRYPLSMMLVCGTQADEQSHNQLVVLRISNLCRTKHDVESDEDSEESYIGDGGESDADAASLAGDNDGGNHTTASGGAAAAGEVNGGEPLVHHRTIAHYGTANRVRCCPHVSTPLGRLVAVWSDAGHVQLFDLDHNVRALCDFANWSKEQAHAAAAAAAGSTSSSSSQKRAALKFCTPASTHKTEGYGLDWSPLRAGVFASGDCHGSLFVWQPAEGGRWRSVASHTSNSSSSDNDGASIEEIQWSPTQQEVLLCARAGGVVEVWDTRDMRARKLAWRADASDINVADWNSARQASHLLVTGADSGVVAVWDLRKLAAQEPIQQLTWHRKSITSVEFSPHNESVLAVTSDEGCCTLWDLSLERDASEEEAVVGAAAAARDDLAGIPDQLMFEHQGQRHTKEGHWHRQIPGMVVTTDYDGLHLFRPMNWRSLMK